MLNLLILEDDVPLVDSIQDVLDDHNRTAAVRIRAKFATSVQGLVDLVHLDASWVPSVAWLDHRVAGSSRGSLAARFLRERFGEDITIFRISAEDEHEGYPEGTTYIPKSATAYHEAIARMFDSGRADLRARMTTLRADLEKADDAGESYVVHAADVDIFRFALRESIADDVLVHRRLRKGSRDL